jgi:hypothetical protein
MTQDEKLKAQRSRYPSGPVRKVKQSQNAPKDKLVLERPLGGSNADLAITHTTGGVVHQAKQIALQPTAPTPTALTERPAPDHLSN